MGRQTALITACNAQHREDANAHDPIIDTLNVPIGTDTCGNRVHFLTSGCRRKLDAGTQQGTHNTGAQQ